MRSRTLLQLRTDVRERADMTGSAFISDANLTIMINQSIAKLWNKLVAARGQDYYEKSVSFITAQGQQIYTFAALSLTDFGQLIQVEITDGTLKRTMQPFMRKEHGRWSEYTVPAGYPITLYYVPAPPLLVADGDNFDGIMGWEEWVVLDVAIQLLNKEESSNVGVLIEEKKEMERLIAQLAPNRDAGFPQRIVDTYRQNNSFMFSGGVPRYRLRGANGLDGSNQAIEVLWGPTPFFGY